MNVVSRGIRNAFRNSIRTFSIVVILGISVGLALSMLVARQAVADKITSVKSSIGNTITISPAGARGFEGGGEALTTKQMTEIAGIEHVTKVSQMLTDRLTTSNTTLKSAIEPGSLGNRAQDNSGVGFREVPSEDGGQGSSRSDSSSSSRPRISRTFTPPVTVTGTNDTSSVATFGSDSVTFTSGESFDAGKNENKAVLGKAIAEKNDLSVGSTFTAYNKKITVVGIYDTGNTFANNGVIVPLGALQRLSNQSDAVTSATVTVDSVDAIDTTVSAVKAKLGSAADVVNDQESAKTAVEPLQSVKTISSYSVVGALIAGALVILLTMMMIVRERRREIGVMKAIGSSNLKTMLQFMSEAVTLTVLGLVVGLVISLVAAQPITKVLVDNSDSSSSSEQVGARRQGGPESGQGRAGAFMRPGNNTATGALRGVQDIQASVGASTLGYGVAVAFIIAIVGSAVPAYFISKIRPAEVMRAD